MLEMLSHVRFDCNSNHTTTAYARPRVRLSEGALYHLHALNPAGLYSWWAKISNGH